MDLANNTTDTPLIAQQANQIPENAIPVNPRVAAEVYLNHLNRRDSRPFKWMLSANKWRKAMACVQSQTGGPI